VRAFLIDETKVAELVEIGTALETARKHPASSNPEGLQLVWY
jgi:hypothetical protein